MPHVSPKGRRHVVGFYGDDVSLFKTVGGFLGEGLVSGHPAVVIATRPHQQGILEDLRTRSIDVDRARRLGDVVLLDADETLSLFMTTEGPSPELFERYVGGVFDQMVQGHRESAVRAYGEMVDLLWQRGEHEAAAQVEALWNELAATFAFSLLCTYAVNHFPTHGAHYQQICALHTDVVHVGARVVPFKRRRA